MNQTYDKFGYPELPYIILCNPNKNELFSLVLAYDTQMTLKLNTLSEFEFLYPESIDGGETILPAFEYLENKRLVLVEGYGYFQIVDCERQDEGNVPIKHVSCQSLEVELIQKRVSIYTGTKKLYDLTTPAGTILNDLVLLAPNWSIGTVDPELMTKYRTMDVSDSNVYEVLMNDCEKAFNCVFFFDTVTRTISAKTVDNSKTATDIFLSFDNVLTQLTFSEKSDEITTCLSVYGDGNLSINLVNPLGTTKIYNFGYYKTNRWMSAGLITALNAWESLVTTQQPIYAASLLLLQTYNSELITLRSQLATLNEQYLALQAVQKQRIQAGQAYADITAQMTAKQAEIDAQNVLIQNKQSQITATTTDLQEINTLVSFQSNFSPTQLLELSNFTFENTYQNDTIIQTDSMSAVEIQAQAQALYDQALVVLENVSQPRFEFEIDSVNYTAIPDFDVFTQQTNLGSIVNVSMNDTLIIETVLLELSFQFDNPEEFSFKFSNRLRLDDGKFVYTDILGSVVKTGSNVSFNSESWSNWEVHKDDVTTFITSALDATVNNLVSNSNQEILINQNGLRARQSTVSGYDPKQAWLVNNVLAFSDDGFQTAKLALGEIPLPEGGTAYGLVADVIVGRLLAGNTLTITNEGSNFTLDSTGATLNNAKFAIQTTNTRITIDPTATDSFVILKNEGGTFVPKFTVTNSGDVVFSGTLSGANGTFSGTISANIGNIGTLVIDSAGLKTADGQNYLRGDGSLKWGGLTISGSSASFNGTIFANKISGQVVDSQVASGLGADKLTYGTMSGNRLFGGTPTVASINGTGASSFLTFGGGIGTSFVSAPGGSSTFGSLTIGGSITVSGGLGTSTVISVSSPSGTKFLTFSRGLLVNVA